MSHLDYCEQMAEHAAENKAYMEANDKSHREKSNPILTSAGMNKSNRKDFRKKNPETDAIYTQTYRQMDNKELRDNFHSDDKAVVAAMAIASQRTANDLSIDSDNLDQLDAKALNKSKFKEHYEEALEDINKGRVDLRKPQIFCSSAGLADLDVKKKNAALNKRSESHGKNSLIETKVGCKDKKCQLTQFSITTPTEDDSDSDIQLGNDPRASSRVNDELEQAAKTTPSPAEFNLDVMASAEPIDQFHFVGGYLDAFKREFKLNVKGSCDYGEDANCPSIDIECDQAKIDKVNEHSYQFKNTNSQLAKLRLNPPKYQKDESKLKIDKIIKLIKPKAFNNTPAEYNLFLTSCSSSGAALYSGYNPSIFIHQQIIEKLSLTLTFESSFTNKFRIMPTVNYVGRFDGATYNYSIDAEEAMKSTQKIVQTFIGDNTLTYGLEKAAEFFQKMKQLDKTDEIEGECPAPENEEQEFEQSSAACLDPAINFSYFRKTVTRPDLNYAEVGVTQSLFISGSPLFKYEKEINLLSVMWRKSMRLGLDIATGGLSIVARHSIQALGIEENINNTFSNFSALMKDAVVKEYHQAKSFAVSLAPEAVQEAMKKVSDEEVSDFCAGNGTTISCKLKLNAAVETDDPNGGFVWSKSPQDDGFSLNTNDTSMYAGVNATIEGEISSDLQFLKSFGISQEKAESFGGGIEAKVLSRDKTGESRFGLTFKFIAEGDDGYDAEKGIKGLCRQTFFSGLAIYIDAFVWKTKSDTGSESNKTVNKQRSSKGGVSTGIGDSGKYKQYRSLMNFCILKDWENDAKPILSNPFSKNITD